MTTLIARSGVLFPPSPFVCEGPKVHPFWTFAGTSPANARRAAPHAPHRNPRGSGLHPLSAYATRNKSCDCCDGAS